LADETGREPNAEPDATVQDPKAALAESDLALVRALEDLIYVLMEKDVIVFTDLPEPVQQQLLRRQRLRERVRGDDAAEDDGLVDL
jgi:hypothetical protein